MSLSITNGSPINNIMYICFVHLVCVYSLFELDITYIKILPNVKIKQRIHLKFLVKFTKTIGNYYNYIIIIIFILFEYITQPKKKYINSVLK